MRFLNVLAVYLFALVLPASSALAWENHPTITRASLQVYETWDEVEFEPIDNALRDLSVKGAAAPASLQQLAQQLNIHHSKIRWDWRPPQHEEGPATALDVLVYASAEPDDGMDQNLDFGPDQKYMGGYTGLSSQAIRHMYYRPFTVSEPLVSFHIPTHEMGLAPERAEVYFELARQAKAKNHLFWAYRFLGWGLHYVQDIGQPYHASQFGSFRLLPMRVLLSVGWEAFMAETKRIVSNFHLAFEQYVAYWCNSNQDSRLLAAFKVPKADEELKKKLEQTEDVEVAAGVKALAIVGSRVVSKIVAAQKNLMGDQLLSSALDLGEGFFENGRPKIDFAALETQFQDKQERKAMYDVAEYALSNTGVATRWYINRFKEQTAELSR